MVECGDTGSFCTFQPVGVLAVADYQYDLSVRDAAVFAGVNQGLEVCAVALASVRQFLILEAGT